MNRRRALRLLAACATGCALRPLAGAAADGPQDARPPADASWLARLPKVELHLHLEGAIPRTTLWELVTKYGGDPAIRSREDLERALVYRDFRNFLQMWVWMTGYLREYDDYTLIGREVARDLARQNIRYVEAFFSPPDFRRSPLSPQRVAEAIRAGLRAVPDVEIALVADLVRDRGADHAKGLLERVAEVRKEGVIGIGIGGWESGFPPEIFESVYERARALGLRTTAHAGEGAGPASVWGAVRALRVDRLGHATRAVEDPALVRHLASARIPLELCPLSNVRTAIIPSVDEHPVRRYFDLGIPVSLNTDDPLFFGNSLVDEFVAVQRFHGFTRQEIRRLILSAVDSSWLPADRKARVADSFRREASWNEPDSVA
jgi:adenosine deaminase